MNLTDYEETPMHVAFEAVRREAERYGAPVVGTEIVGLIPRKALEMSAEYFRRHGERLPEAVLEDRLWGTVEPAAQETPPAQTGGGTT
jgi:glutamate formiminotransferase